MKSHFLKYFIQNKQFKTHVLTNLRLKSIFNEYSNIY